VRHQRRQSFDLIVCPAVVDGDVLALEITRVLEASRNARSGSANLSGDWGLRNPTTGIAAARAASGHAANGPDYSID